MAHASPRRLRQPRAACDFAEENPPALAQRHDVGDDLHVAQPRASAQPPLHEASARSASPRAPDVGVHPLAQAVDVMHRRRRACSACLDVRGTRCDEEERRRGAPDTRCTRSRHDGVVAAVDAMTCPAPSPSPALERHRCAETRRGSSCARVTSVTPSGEGPCSTRDGRPAASFPATEAPTAARVAKNSGKLDRREATETEWRPLSVSGDLLATVKAG